MSMKLYFDLLSQPSRSLYIILKLSNIPFQARQVPLRRGAHLTDEFKHNVSKFQRVPVLHDADFKLTERCNMSMKLYFDLLSQPSRSLYIILKLSNIPFEACQVPLRKGAHLTDEYKNNVSRFQRVPVLHDADFKLTESVAILRYLAHEKNLPDKWYPKDSKKQARVDEYLEWQHNNTRALCAMYFRKKWLTPLMTGSEESAEKLAGYEQRMADCLDMMETLWLSETPYIAGDHITAADLWAACEIEQPRVAGYDPTKGRPILGKWLERVRQETSPAYTEAHTILNKLASKAQAKL